MITVVPYTGIIIIVWTTVLISMFRIRDSFIHPLPQQRIKRPVMILIVFVFFIVLNVQTCYDYLDYGRIDILIGIEAYMFISAAILIFTILRQLRGRSDKNMTKVVKGSSGYFESSQSPRTNFKTSKDSFRKVGRYVGVISFIIVVISLFYDCEQGVVAGFVIAFLFLIVGLIFKRYT